MFFYSFSDQISRLVYYCTYLLFASHKYENPLLGFFHIQFSQYYFYLGLVFSDEILYLGDSTPAQ